jgi:hypothetical protein
MLLALCILPVRAQQSAVPSSAPASNGSAPQSVNDKMADLDKRVTAAQFSGDNAWMLVSTAGGLLNASLGGKFPTLDFAFSRNKLSIRFLQLRGSLQSLRPRDLWGRCPRS